MAGLKVPFGLSPRVERLRAFYFEGADRPWHNEFSSWTTGTPWDVQYLETNYYIVPEVYALLGAVRGSFRQAARPVALRPDFWEARCPSAGPGSSRR